MQDRQSRERREEEDARIDWGIILSVMVLAIIGMLSIYVAASHDTSTMSVPRTLISQAMWYAIGIGAIIFIMQFDAEQLCYTYIYSYGLGITLLVLVLIFYSRAYALKTGAKSWLAFGPLTFQPSEVMKPAYILMLGRVVAQHNAEFYEHTIKTDWNLIGKLALWTLPVAVLLKLQNDFGTMLVFFAILSGVILVSGVSWKILAPLFGGAAFLGTAGILLAVYGRNLLMAIGFKAYQFARIEAWLNPSASTTGNSYQLWQSMKAIGSGQLFGTGFNHSNVYVPVRESDMIFSVIGENFGFIGGCILIFIYLLLIFQMIQVTFDTRNEFLYVYLLGVIMMILFHVFENIGMSIGLLPLTGIPLPFISQGGSALIANMIGIGLIMSMRYHNKSYMFSSSKEFR